MADVSELRAVVEAVVDPALDVPIGGLGYLADLKRKVTGGVIVSLRVPLPGEERSAVVAAVTDAVRAHEGGKSVRVDAELMTDAERSALMTTLRGEKRQIGGTGSRTRVVAVSSGKGGVGKSSITSNLAVTLRRRGHSVGVIDADVWGFSIPRMLGSAAAPAVIDESIIPPIAHGVKVMSMDYFVPEDQAVVWRGPMLHKALEQFLVDVFWNDPEYLLIDMPPGTGDVAISISQFLPRAEMLLVTTPQPTAQRVAERAALMADKVNQRVLGVVENMSYFVGDDGKRYEIFGAGGGGKLAADIGTDLLAQIALVPAMREGADAGVPVSIAAPDSDAAKGFETLATALIERPPRVRTHPDLVIG